MTAKDKKVKALAKLLGATVVGSEENTNGFGGYDDFARAIESNKEVYLVCTCGNCGSGASTRLTKLLKLIKTK